MAPGAESRHLTSISSLDTPGEWSPRSRLWCRTWTLPDGAKGAPTLQTLQDLATASFFPNPFLALPVRGGALAVELMEDLAEADIHGTNCLWSSSLALARLLETGLPSELPDHGLEGAHVLELGAGLGLSSMVAAARGAFRR
jgi:hypothetical protein